MSFFIKQKQWIARLFFLILAAIFFLTPSLSFGNQGKMALEKEFMALKNNFENEVKKTKDTKKVSSLALYTTALSWSLVKLTQEPDVWQTKINAFKNNWELEKNLMRREILALQLYFDALSSLVADQTERENGLADSLHLVTVTAESLKAADNSLGSQKMILLEALNGLLALYLKETISPFQAKELTVIMVRKKLKDEEIKVRAGTHIKGRESFLALNSVQSLTERLFLLGRILAPGMDEDFKQIAASLAKNNKNSPVPQAESLALVAQAQVSLPLAFWLASK